MPERATPLPVPCSASENSAVVRPSRSRRPFPEFACAGAAAGRRRKTGDRARSHQRLADGIAREIMHELRPTEAHLNLRGMHIHVHFVVRHVQKQQRRGKNSSGQNVAVRFVNRVQNQAIADQPPIHKNVNTVAIGALHFRARSKTTDGERGFFLLRLKCRFGDRRTESRSRGRYFG